MKFLSIAQVALMILFVSVNVSGSEKQSGNKNSILFNDTEYLYRWSDKGLYEFTPEGQEDLDKWTDMLSIRYYQITADGEGLAFAASSVLENYKKAGAYVFRKDSVPRTKNKPAEHLIGAVFFKSNFQELVLARFKIVNGASTAIIHSHRIYGKGATQKMSSWAEENSKSLEIKLMSFKGVPSRDSLGKESGHITRQSSL